MAAGNAVFTEVLQIGIDTSVFAAQMKQVEQIYSNSIKNMPQLGQMGQQLAGQSFQKAAKDIADAAQSIETNVITMSQTVTNAMTKMATSAQAAGAATAKGAKAAVSGVSEHMSTMERFGNALETAFIRIPARMAAISALAVVTGALAIPVKLLADGFKNLAEQTPEFKQLRTEIADTLSIIESVAAKPLFDAVVNSMRELNSWLIENKPLIEQVAFAFGGLLKAVLEPLFNLLKSKPTGLLEVVTTLTTAFGIGLSTIKLLGVELADLMRLFMALDPSKPFKQMAKDTKAALQEMLSDFKQFGKEQLDLATANVAVGEAAKGDGHAAIPGVKAASQLQTSSEIMTQYREELSGAKEDHKKAMDAISEQENRQVINKETAKGKIVAAVAEEKKAIDALIAKYQELLKTATDINQLDSSKMRQKVDMLLMGGRGSNSASPFAAGEAETKRATEDADKEALTAKSKSLADEKSLVEKAYTADVALDKKAESEKQATHEATVRAEMALEEARHQQIVALNAQMPDGAVNTPNYLAKQKAAADEQQKNDAAVTASKQALVQATREDTAATLAYSEAVAKVRIVSLEAEDKEAVALNNKRKHLSLTKEIIEAELQLAQAEVTAAERKLASDTGPAADKDRVLIESLNAQIERLKTQLAGTNYSSTSLGKFEHAEDTGNSTSVGQKLIESLHLDDAAQDFQNANNAVEKFGAVLEGATSIVTALTGAVTGAIAGYKKAGAMGAAGSLLSNQKVDNAIGSGIGKVGDSIGGSVGGALSSVGSMMPMIGPLIGGMFNAITSMFQASIQTMVDNINQKISDINQQAQLKQIGIQQQIAELKAEEQTAINELGGKKKAQSQLDGILKSLDSQIAQLQFQAAQTVQQFNDMVSAASLGKMTGVMASWASTWQQINQQVEQYIQAGGSVATAAEYLNQQLQQQRQTLQDQMNQGDQTAINDAIQLNKLLTQRLQMMKDEAATEFGMINADSMERQTSNAVKLGTELSKQRAQYALQLQDTNSQISLDQSRVAAEGKVFTIATSLAALQAQSNALNLAALNEQLAKYQDMATLLKATNGMVFTPSSINPGAGLNGTQAGIPGEPTVTGPITFQSGAIVINGDVTSQNATTLASEIASNLRAGRTSF